MSLPQGRFHSAAVLGTGMMGPGIAACLALGGLRSTIVSRGEQTAAEALRRARAQISLLEDAGLVEAGRAAAARDLLAAASGWEPAVSEASIVIESAPENMAFKQDLFEKLGQAARADAVLASNTSGLSITAIASRCKHPERVLTTHFWNPPHLMPLVEIVRGEKTDPALADAVRDLLSACGKQPVIVKKDTPGQLGNRLQMALVREAVHVVEQGIADVEDVDLAVKIGFGLRLPVYGIFEHQDIVGLDLGMSVVDYVATDLNCERKAPALMRRLVEQGDLGVKTGKGFYDWSKKDAGEVKALRDRFVLDFLRAGWGKKTGGSGAAG